jgi:hypothetical protein
MKKILSDYYLLLLLVLIVGFFSKSVLAADMRVHYHCLTDKSVSFETAEGPLLTARELNYSPEQGKSLNLVVGRFPSHYQFWIRKPLGQNKRFASVFLGSKLLPETIDLGEEGEVSTAVFPFQLRDGDDRISGQCEIRVE